jgi:hypothetical protein
MHILVREIPAGDTLQTIPEDPGVPIMLLYGPDAIIKVRKQTPDASQNLQTLGECIFKLSQGRLKIGEQLQTTE